MITISEKIAHTSLHQIKLYKQGLFWVAYEQSAYYMWQLKGFKPTKKWFKNIKSQVVQVGFTNIEEVLKTEDSTILEKQDTYVCFNSIKAMELHQFEDWKNTVVLSDVKDTSPIQNVQKNKGLAESILAFDITNKTPIDALLFINELKKIITDGNLR